MRDAARIRTQSGIEAYQRLLGGLLSAEAARGWEFESLVEDGYLLVVSRRVQGRLRPQGQRQRRGNTPR